MIRGTIDSFSQFVTTHNRLTIVIVLLITAGLAVGVTQDAGAGADTVDDDALGHSDVWQAAEYIDEHYTVADQEDSPNTVAVIVRQEGRNVFTADALLETLSYQQDIIAEEDVTSSFDEEGLLSPPTLIAQALSGDAELPIDEQKAVVEDASEEEIAAAVSETFSDQELARQLLPLSYAPGDETSEGYRILVNFDTSVDVGYQAMNDPDSPDATLHELSEAYEDPGIYVEGPYMWADANEKFLSDAVLLVIPPILVVMLGVLAFAYRDLTDVIIGFIGTIVSLIWMFGVMGWLGLLNEQTAIIAPVLIAALSIDFGFHVFMRYRERRNPGEAIRAALQRSTAAVAIAFLLVTVTAGIGFLANLASPVPLIRDLGVAITLGVVGALVVFTTLIPALKVSADGLWERFGFSRQKQPLGKGKYLSRILSLGIQPGTHGAVILVVIAVLLGGIGGLAFLELDREPFQQAEFDDVAEWKTQLPGPMAFEAHESEAIERAVYAQEAFQPDDSTVTEGGQGMTQFLIEGEGSVASEGALLTAAAVEESAAEADSEIVLAHGGDVGVISPLTVMAQLAESDTEFATIYAKADTTGDEVPDQNIEGVFDAFFEIAPEEASALLERTDEGEYRSMIVMVPAQTGFGSERADEMHWIAGEAGETGEYDVIAVGAATIEVAETELIAIGIIETMLLAIFAVLVLLSIIYWLARGSALLGAVTVIPIALTLGFVFGSMALVGQPLTMLTALLVSITIGLGIDYNIHVSDRFAQELERGNDVETALSEAVTGTGGALLGSALTSGAAFALLALVPHPQFRSFGLIVALALALSFLLSVFLLPSLLRLWAIRYDADRLRPALSLGN